MNTEQKIAVLGAGSWGTALAIVLARHGCRVQLWDLNHALLATINLTRCNTRYLPNIPLPDQIVTEPDLAKVLANQHDILVVVPSHGFKSLIEKIRPFWKPHHRLAWGTKGVDPQSGHLLSQIVTDCLGAVPMALLSGPSFAKEVAADLPTAIAMACTDDKFAQDLMRCFHRSRFRVYRNTDMVGMQICGVVKNVIAIAAGASDGLGFGANARSALITRGIAELARLCLAMGGQLPTVMGLAGIGDLVLTCSDNQSRNRRLGFALAQNQTIAQAQQAIGQVVEGIGNSMQVTTLGKRFHVEMPICEQVAKVILGEHTMLHAMTELLERKPAREDYY